METKSPFKIVTRDEFCVERVPEPCAVVIFGASGDLARRKLIPAFYDLYQARLLPKGCFIIGFARTPGDDESFRNQVSVSLTKRHKADGANAKEFLELCYYVRGDYTEKESFGHLAKKLSELGSRYGEHRNILFYLATPPEVYRELVVCLGETGLVRTDGRPNPSKRVVFEKPFGRNLHSARALNSDVGKVLDESQIYRIDHYLGKETVQNILIFRFTNLIFEPIWNRRYVDHVQITAAETLGVENRAGYYDQAGTLRDMFQNHMFQLLSLVAMEPPHCFDADRYRDEKVKLLRSVRPMSASDIDQFVVRGQYGRDGKSSLPYREEKGIRSDSSTETFVALRLFIDNDRWRDVPFYLRSGKRLSACTTEIAIQFKTIPHSIFSSLGIDTFPPNVLVLRIQPNEGIFLSFEAKHPGPKFCMATLGLEFDYKEVFKEEPLGAYERLLLDCMLGDQTLFVRQDMVEESWGFITNILNRWKLVGTPEFPNYAAGSWGPDTAFQLIRNDGRFWREI